MHLYKDNVIVKYKNANAILDDFIKIRLHAYNVRKEYIIKVLEREMAVINYRKKFIEQILNKEIVIERKKKAEIIARLVELKYPELSTGESAPKGSYDYLTTLPLWCLTQEKIDDMNKEYNEKKHELDTYTSTSIQELWSTEICKIEDIYNKMLSHVNSGDNKVVKVSKSKKSKKVIATK
jgi:DNA topoisomerase-2